MMTTAADASEAPRFTFFSVNDHFIEPRHTFQSRLPKRLQDRAPRVVDADVYGEQWVFDGVVRPIMFNCATAGVPKSEWVPASGRELVRLEDLRAGCYDPKARLADMDLDGVVASACYSSPATMGFVCDLFSLTSDAELGIASMRAWNDWYHEEWAGAAPDRFVPIQATWYRDAEVAAAEVRRNAERGFKGVAFRNPTDLDMPSIGSGYWDPFLAACEETGTVLCHHTESLAHWPKRVAGAPYAINTVLFQASAMETVLSWIWGGLPTRFPKLRVTVAESGGTWLPYLMWRMRWAVGFSSVHSAGWPEPGATPLDLLTRSFVFSTLEPDTADAVERELGLTGWMLESDYPHMESVWPDSQNHFARELAAWSPQAVRDFTWANASRLYRHEVPARL